MSKLTSKISYAKRGYNSMKTIVPAAIVQMLELKKGDTFQWNIETRNKEKIIVIEVKSRSESG